MARKRPTASNVTRPVLTSLDGDRPHADGPLLTRSEVNALRRSAPLTHEQLSVHLAGIEMRAADQPRG